MSNTFDIYCDDCKVKYWYGQTSSGKPFVYNAELLQKFLIDHCYHKLHSSTEYSMELDEINTSEYKEYEGEA